MPSLEPYLRHSLLGKRAWRLRNLYTIVDDQSRLIAFRPNGGQRQFYRDLHFCNHVLKARKLGFSTFIELLNLDDLLFGGGHLTAGIVDKGIDDAKRKLRMMRTAYDHLDNRELHPETWELGAMVKRFIPLLSDTREELRWANGSTAYCGTSLRGGTTNRLHISELGSIAIRFPLKAREILEGAMNSFTPGNRCDIETTHEGGRVGLNYALMRTSMGNIGKPLTPVDFRFHFFPWWRDSRYTLADALPVQPHTADYFRRLAQETGHDFSHGQMLWYERKAETQGYGMKKEFPSTPGEAFEAIANGAIYGREMADLRGRGRILAFEPEASYPLYTFWDIGLSDYGVMWLIQPVGRAGFLVLDWFEVEGRSASGFADQVRLWEAKWRRPIARHFLPHDANTRERGSGRNYVAHLQECGLRNLAVVPRTPDVWVSIGYVRDLLPHCWFHANYCDHPRNRDGGPYRPGTQDQEFPSGVACLEGYSRDTTSTALREMPKHDECSHSADAFRTFATAWKLGMIQAEESLRAPAQAVNGPRKWR